MFQRRFRPGKVNQRIATRQRSRRIGADGNANSAKYIGDGPGKIGPFPGMVVGGPNGSMKRYVEGLNWQASPWEFNEPDITYQSPCCQLLGYFALKSDKLKSSDAKK